MRVGEEGVKAKSTGEKGREEGARVGRDGGRQNSQIMESHRNSSSASSLHYLRSLSSLNENEKSKNSCGAIGDGGGGLSGTNSTQPHGEVIRIKHKISSVLWNDSDVGNDNSKHHKSNERRDADRYRQAEDSSQKNFVKMSSRVAHLNVDMTASRDTEMTVTKKKTKKKKRRKEMQQKVDMKAIPDQESKISIKDKEGKNRLIKADAKNSLTEMGKFCPANEALTGDTKVSVGQVSSNQLSKAEKNSNTEKKPTYNDETKTDDLHYVDPSGQHKYNHTETSETMNQNRKKVENVGALGKKVSDRRTNYASIRRKRYKGIKWMKKRKKKIQDLDKPVEDAKVDAVVKMPNEHTSLTPEDNKCKDKESKNNIEESSSLFTNLTTATNEPKEGRKPPLETSTWGESEKEAKGGKALKSDELFSAKSVTETHTQEEKRNTQNGEDRDHKEKRFLSFVGSKHKDSDALKRKEILGIETHSDNDFMKGGTKDLKISEKRPTDTSTNKYDLKDENRKDHQKGDLTKTGKVQFWDEIESSYDVNVGQQPAQSGKQHGNVRRKPNQRIKKGKLRESDNTVKHDGVDDEVQTHSNESTVLLVGDRKSNHKGKIDIEESPTLTKRRSAMGGRKTWEDMCTSNELDKNEEAGKETIKDNEAIATKDGKKEAKAEIKETGKDLDVKKNEKYRHGNIEESPTLTIRRSAMGGRKTLEDIRTFNELDKNKEAGKEAIKDNEPIATKDGKKEVKAEIKETGKGLDVKKNEKFRHSKESKQMVESKNFLHTSSTKDQMASTNGASSKNVENAKATLALAVDLNHQVPSLRVSPTKTVATDVTMETTDSSFDETFQKKVEDLDDEDFSDTSGTSDKVIDDKVRDSACGPCNMLCAFDDDDDGETDLDVLHRVFSSGFKALFTQIMFDDYSCVPACNPYETYDEYAERKEAKKAGKEATKQKKHSGG